ncbi:MAG: hypothetical protein WDO19_28115 [Bacteroidota bacterium]
MIAFPVAWWAMHTWLQDFAYRVNIGWWVFAIAGISAVVIAFGNYQLPGSESGIYETR